MTEFVHLHMHSEFSLLDGANRIKDLPKRAKELGMKAMAITDHGVMFGVIDFYKACKNEGIKPIIGCEMYVAPRSRLNKEPIDKNYYHLTVLAKNNMGYQNLSKLVSQSYIDGYYYKPRIDRELLKQYHEGLVVLSGCLSGEINQNLFNGNMEKAEETINWYSDLFGEDYYIEIQNNGVKEQNFANQKLIQLARKHNIQLVATNDSHYLTPKDAYSHEIELCIQTGKRITDEDRMKFDSEELYVKSPEEMAEYFKNFPDAIENTVKIAEKCTVEFEFGHTILPNYEVPKEYATHYDYFKKLCDDGIKNRYGENPPKEILQRAEYELKIISQMGYVDYYLIVWDYINYARSVGIPVGPGRGSGAGSILAYAIGITDIDPMKYNLLFERFLNPERVSMPDFDVDFCYERRGEVIEYVERKYGKDHVSQIITFGTMSAKMVIRDVGRVLDLPYATCDKVAKMVPNELHITLKQALEKNKELKEIYDTNQDIHKMIDIAMSLEGMPRNTSTHACGIVITKEPVANYVPLYVRDDQISTQYIMTTLEELGLLKMDFLGLRTLTVIQDAINLVKKIRGIDVKFDKDMSDPNVYKLWQNGETVGIFQFESQGITRFMKELKPDSLEDIIAGVSLYRPGPMDQIPRYIKNKKNPEHAEYTHDSLIPILKVTYGCMVYQEQVMQIVRDLAGYSLGRADLVRRAMGKKKLDVMAKERENFIYGQTDENGKILIKGCIRNGIDEKSANKIFDEMAEFAKYAFNKSHAAAYAVVSYRTAFLKAYYPAEFMAATMNSYLGNLDKIPMYIDECKRLNIKVLKPDINKSYTKFSVEKFTVNNKTNMSGVRFGLGSIKNVGVSAVEAIVNERKEHGEYKDFADFCERTQNMMVNKKCIESLIRAGAFDNFSQNRATLLASFEDIIDSIQSEKRKVMDGQMSMFDLNIPMEEMEKQKYKYTNVKDFSEKEKLSMEKEMIGVYISGNPLEKYKAQIEKFSNIDSQKLKELGEMTKIKDEEMENDELGASDVAINNVDLTMGKKFQEFYDGQKIKVAGMVSKIKKKYTKNNKIMAFVTIEDLRGSFEVLVFENCYNDCEKALVEENIVEIEGRLSISEGKPATIIASEIRPLNEGQSKVLTIDINGMPEDDKAKLRGIIKFFHSDRNNMSIQVSDDGVIKPCGMIFFNNEILKEFENLVGKERIEI